MALVGLAARIDADAAWWYCQAIRIRFSYSPRTAWSCSRWARSISSRARSSSVFSWGSGLTTCAVMTVGLHTHPGGHLVLLCDHVGDHRRLLVGLPQRVRGNDLLFELHPQLGRCPIGTAVLVGHHNTRIRNQPATGAALLACRNGNRLDLLRAVRHTVPPVRVPRDRLQPERRHQLADRDRGLLTSRGHHQHRRAVLVEGLQLGLPHRRTLARELLLAVLIDLLLGTLRHRVLVAGVVQEVLHDLPPHV